MGRETEECIFHGCTRRAESDGMCDRHWLWVAYDE